ncbi:AraC family transcriptional regulator [Paenibacillus beijingensis]|uniref:AraC family transcriptional regulator n=1 Tax=Paenibacillus beijingensis TaxID=1126833 RepID=A0A0D5NIE6_9BACL|nr:AraC family transcriptional regulator [Paenibacillus beijingensis]AJY75134.1 AraC family transcriptional regulator [Paenibacillus beijingensis]
MDQTMREDHHEYLDIHYFTPTDYEKAGPAWPIRLGHNIAKPNYHIGPRTTAYYYLMFVLEGEGTFIQNGQTFKLGQNDMFCLFPQVTHEYFTAQDRPLRKIFVAFDGKKALDLLEAVGLTSRSPHRSGILSAEAIQLMWGFFNYVVHTGGNDNDFGRLARFLLIFDHLSKISVPSGGTGSDSLSWLQKGVDYMEIHYAEGITVGSVAKYVGIDRTHFTKQFRRVYGLTPVQYIQQLKTNEAKLLLEQTTYSLTEIAHSVGYPDLFSFSKAFKKNAGIPPKQYRLQRLLN